MFWSLVRPDRILLPITRSAAMTTSLEADELAGIVQLPANAPQAAPGQSRGLPRGPGIEENSQTAETRARRRLEKVIYFARYRGAKGNAGRSEPTTFNLALLLQRNNK